MDEIKLFKQANQEVLKVIENLESQIFNEGYKPGRFSQEARQKPRFVALIAHSDNQPVGFKVGYELEAGVFYSWLGGVLPAHRGQGVARRLLDEQHTYAKAKGYKILRTTTRNKWQAMLIFNIKNGFKIVGADFKSEENDYSIKMEKVI